MSAAVDEVWRGYHKGVQAQLTEMAKVTGSTQAAALLALRVMKTLVKMNYRKPKVSPVGPCTLTERDTEIITYISGFLIRRFRQLPEAQALRGTTTTGFTAAIDRGGLMKPIPEFVSIVLEMERVFRELPTTSVNRADYEKKIADHDLPRLLFELLEEVESPTEKKEAFYCNMTNLFFTVRAHQKCRHFMQQHVNSTHTVRRSKALRDSLN